MSVYVHVAGSGEAGQQQRSLLTCVLALPYGPHSRWFHGSVNNGIFSLLAVAREERCPCLSPRDGSCTILDAVLLDLALGREATLAPLARTGGALARLSPASLLLASGSTDSHSAEVCFEPSRALGEGAAPALCTLASLFPSLASALVARGPSVIHGALVVEGLLSVDESALRWRPLDAPDSVCAALLRRRWLADECEDEVDEDAGVTAAGQASVLENASQCAPDADGWIVVPRLAQRLAAAAAATIASS